MSGKFVAFSEEDKVFLNESCQSSDDKNREKRLARKYYDKLFKEYCIADLSKYKENKAGNAMENRERSDRGKRFDYCLIFRFCQFICGARRCSMEEDLTTWEVNFGYVEHNEKKNALVKLNKDVVAQLSEDSSEETNEGGKESKIWSQQPKVSETEDKSKTEEMEEFLEDLFL
ncbi:Protein FRA10AC1 [Nymphon striatum]|nr:Protein FRA10AC1 [Nymphon striatum]